MTAYNEKRLDQAVQSANLLLRSTGRDYWRVEAVRRGRREVAVRLLSDRGTVVRVFPDTRQAYAYVLGLRDMMVESGRDDRGR